MTLSLARPAHEPRDHAVNLYDHFDDVVPEVVAQLVDGLVDGGAAVLVATPAHRRIFDAEISEHVDLALAVADGRYVALDAWETLGQISVAGVPDRARFHAVIGQVIDTVGAKGRRIHAFGEMVALLWEAGDRWSAIELESFWNELAQNYRFSLSCTYPIAALRRTGDLSAISAVCSNHSSVTMPSSYRIGSADAATADVADRSEVFLADVLAVRAVRRFVVDALGDLDESVGGAAALVASELAANAIDHVGSPFRVTMRRANGTVTIAVEDLSPDRPERVNNAVDAIRGRGLRIIDALCSRWGTDVGPSGKVVWAELAPA